MHLIKNVSIFKTISGLVEWHSGENAMSDLGWEIAKIIEVLNELRTNVFCEYVYQKLPRCYLLDHYSMNQATFQCSFYILANQDYNRVATKSFV